MLTTKIFADSPTGYLLFPRTSVDLSVLVTRSQGGQSWRTIPVKKRPESSEKGGRVGNKLLLEEVTNNSSQRFDVPMHTSVVSRSLLDCYEQSSFFFVLTSSRFRGCAMTRPSVCCQPEQEQHCLFRNMRISFTSVPVMHMRVTHLLPFLMYTKKTVPISSQRVIISF